MEDEVPMLVSQEGEQVEEEKLLARLERKQKKKVPITLITGFLGSGKTTLLKYVLHEEHGYRIAVVQNEFGEEIGLERAVAMGKKPQLMNVEEKSSGVQEWLELPNGCICCTAKDNLILALERLVERRDRFDYIFIETTGMADPGPLAKTLWVDEELCSSVYLDAVITLVDAKLIRFHLHGTSDDSSISLEPRKLEALRQIALADVLLINKTDLISTQDAVDIQSELEKLNGLAKIFLTRHSRVDLSAIMNIHSFDGNKLHDSLSHADHHHEHEHDHTHHNTSNALPHASGVHTLLLKVDGHVKSPEIAIQWFADLLWEEKLAIYRIKGELSIHGQSRRYIVQGVYDNFEVIPTEFEWDETLPTPTMGKTNSTPISTERRNTLVFIGINLDHEKIRESFCKFCLTE